MAADTFSDIKRRPQRQDSLVDQLRDLCRVADRLGMYDAFDFLIPFLNPTATNDNIERN